MTKHIILTIPTIIPSKRKYKGLRKQGFELGVKLRSFFEDGWEVQHLSSTSIKQIVYNTYVLVKEEKNDKRKD